MLAPKTLVQVALSLTYAHSSPLLSKQQQAGRFQGARPDTATHGQEMFSLWCSRAPRLTEVSGSTFSSGYNLFTLSVLYIKESEPV